MRHRRLAALRSSGRLVVHHAGRTTAEFHHGSLVAVYGPTDGAAGPTLPFTPGEAPLDTAGERTTGKEEADELHCVAAWLHAEADRLVAGHCDGILAEPVDRPPGFAPSRTPRRG